MYQPCCWYLSKRSLAQTKQLQYRIKNVSRPFLQACVDGAELNRGDKSFGLVLSWCKCNAKENECFNFLFQISAKWSCLTWIQYWSLNNIVGVVLWPGLSLSRQSCIMKIFGLSLEVRLPLYSCSMFWQPFDNHQTRAHASKSPTFGIHKYTNKEEEVFQCSDSCISKSFNVCQKNIE